MLVKDVIKRIETLKEDINMLNIFKANTKDTEVEKHDWLDKQVNEVKTELNRLYNLEVDE